MKRASGFTLLELLIVIAIIGILAAVLIPNLLSARGVTYERNALLHSKNVYSVVLAHMSEDPNNNIILGDCSNGFVAGAYATPAPDNPRISTCVVQDANADFLPEVVTTLDTGAVIQYP